MGKNKRVMDNLLSSLKELLKKNPEIFDSYADLISCIVNNAIPMVVSVIGGDKSHGAFAPVASGSGLIIDSNGYILTNSHLITGYSKIFVMLQSGKPYEGKVVGNDPVTDIAVLHINASKLPSATISSPAALLGQLVIAIGNPYGYQSTVSTGIVSAIDRRFQGENGRVIPHVIQHTAPLNPGSSGGPLINSNGVVMRLNTAIISIGHGIGFAIPAKTFSYITTELLSKGKVTRPYIGIAAIPKKNTLNFIRLHDLIGNTILEIVNIDDSGPAKKAGILKGDRLIKIGEAFVFSVDEIYDALTNWPIGNSFTATILRGEKRMELPVTPVERQL
jgi:S1-C subfamily serine protease